MKLFSLLLLVCLLLVVEGRPLFAPPYHGFHELAHPAYSDGKLSKQTFQHVDENGKFIKLEYEVHHHEGDIINMDEETDIESLNCSENQLSIEFKDKTMEEHIWHKDQFLVGSRGWGCRNSENVPTVILRRIVDVKRGENRMFVLTQNVHYVDLIKNGTISFRTNKFPKDHFTELHNKREIGKRSQKTHKRDLFSFFSRIWGAIQSFADTISDIVDAVAIGIELLTTGAMPEFEKAWKLDAISFNYDESTGKSRGPFQYDTGIVCEDCFAHLELEFVFHLNINNYQVINLTALAVGTAAFQVLGDLKVAESSTSNVFDLGTITMNPITFLVAGIPFVLSTTIPIKGGYEANVDAYSEVQSQVSSSASISYGFSYTSAAGWKLLNNHQFQHAGNLNSMASQVQLSALIYITPVIFLQVDKIGGPFASFKPFLETTASVSGTNGCAQISNTNSLVSVNFGFQVAAGLKVDIEAAGFQILSGNYTATVYSTKKRIISGCIYLNDDNTFSLEDGPVLEGDIWTGRAFVISSDPSCSVYSNQTEVTVQLVDTSNGYQFVFNLNGVYDHGICIAQALYVGTVDQFYSISLQPAVESDNSLIGYVKCQNPSVQVYVPAEIDGFVNVEDNSMSATSQDGCLSMQLSRV